MLFLDISQQTTMVFQDDNAPVHRTCVVEEYKHANDIRGAVWQAKSPKINIIVNC